MVKLMSKLGLSNEQPNREAVDDEWEFTSVVLEKSSTRQGFGIAISGGKDNPHFKTGDTSILVTDIIKGSPADGTLKIGDKLISVNDKVVDGGSHKDAVLALKAAGMQARMEIKRPASKKPPAPEIIDTSSPDPETTITSTPKEERGRDRKRPKEMEQETTERERSRAGEDGEKPRRRSRSRDKAGEEGEEKPRRSKSRDKSGTEGDEKPRRHRSKSRDRGENGEEKPRRSKSRDRADGEEKPRRSKSRDPGHEKGEDEKKEDKPRSKSKSRDRAEGDGEKRHRRSKGKDKSTAETPPAEAVPAEPAPTEAAPPEPATADSTPVAEAPPVETPSLPAEPPALEATPPPVEAPPTVVVEEAPAQVVAEPPPEETSAVETSLKVEAPKSPEGDKPKKKKREKETKNEEEPRAGRSRSRGREKATKEEEPRAARSRSRGRSKSRSRDDLTRTKSKESLHRSKSKSRENLIPPGSELSTVVLERGNQGYGFSLGQQIFVRDMAAGSPADKAENLEKGDIVYEINGTRVDNLKVSECIEIIRAATEQLTITLIKKPKEVKLTDVESKPEKKKGKPKPDELAEAKVEPVEPEPTEVVVEKLTEAIPVQQEKEGEEDEGDESPSTPVRSELNETTDSWAQASPEKPEDKIEPTQEVENMDAKLERLKAGRRFETRMSQLPNARVISFHKTGSVGIQVAGGNSLGIFVAAIREDSAAAKEGLKPGDQILMCNEIDFEDITREEAVLILLALPDDVSLVVESKKETFDQIKKELGDNFFIRVNFDHSEKTNQNELTFRKGEIFNVRDTMYQGLIGYWQAQRVGKNAQMLERGVLPNKSRAEQLAIAQKMEERQATMPGRSKVKRRPSLSSTLKKHKFVSQDRLDESSFADSVQIPAYERVVLKIADFMRPVVVLGALGDLVRLKLLEEMPDRFDVPTPMDLGSGGTDATYDNAIKISEIRNVIVKNKHCLLDITPEGIEMLMYAQLCPIVILLKSTSRGAVKEMRASLVQELKNSPTGVTIEGDPATAKQVKKVFSNAKKLEELYPHIFTAKINTHIAGADVLSREFYYKLKEIVFSQQAQSAWMPEEKPQEALDDIVFRPPNYTSYLSGADSDTEGESMTSSPVMAKKHYEDEDEEEEDEAPPSPEPVPEPEPRKHREKSKDRTRSSGRSRDRSGEEDGEDREHRKHRKTRRKSEPDSPTVPPRVVSSPALEAEPSIGELEELIVGVEAVQNDQAPDVTDVSGYPDEYEDPPSPRSYRDPPSINSNEDEEEYVYGHGEPEPEEDIPVLKDPNYSLPRPVPDSPPTRRPPELQTRPLNSVKVMPSDTSLEEKRRSLKPVSDDDPLLAFAESGHVNGLEEMAQAPPPKKIDEEADSPPSRPPPPPEREEVPTKILTLKERMSKLQSKAPAPISPPAPRPLPAADEDEPPPPARPAAPRNYINDMRCRGAPRKDLYAQNIVTPSPEFPEITRIQKPVSEEEEAPPTSNGDGEPIVIATARGLFDHRGGLLESVETNVSIFIPYGALPEGKKEEIYFKVCQDSQHMPPLDANSGETLLSPLVMCGPHGLKFKKPIELRLPHRGASNDSMAFSLKSSDSPVGHPGDWRNVKLGDSDIDGGRAYQVSDDTVSVLVDHF